MHDLSLILDLMQQGTWKSASQQCMVCAWRGAAFDSAAAARTQMGFLEHYYLGTAVESTCYLKGRLFLPKMAQVGKL